jgi:hypothetical protein
MNVDGTVRAFGEITSQLRKLRRGLVAARRNSLPELIIGKLEVNSRLELNYATG